MSIYLILFILLWECAVKSSSAACCKEGHICCRYLDFHGIDLAVSFRAHDVMDPRACPKTVTCLPFPWKRSAGIKPLACECRCMPTCQLYAVDMAFCGGEGLVTSKNSALFIMVCQQARSLILGNYRLSQRIKELQCGRLPELPGKI